MGARAAELAAPRRFVNQGPGGGGGGGGGGVQAHGRKNFPTPPAPGANSGQTLILFKKDVREPYANMRSRVATR